MGELDFTNRDARLRPAGAPVSIPMKDKSDHAYLVTSETFPELYRDFEAMQKQAGCETPFTLLISDALDKVVFADTDLDNHIMRIRFSAFQQHSYKDILFHLGHEYGHIWRDIHPETTFLGASKIPMPRVNEELEADLLGVCFTHDKQAVLDWNKRGGHGKSADYPNKAVLERSVQALQWSECPGNSTPATSPEIAIKYITKDIPSH